MYYSPYSTLDYWKRGARVRIFLLRLESTVSGEGEERARAHHRMLPVELDEVGERVEELPAADVEPIAAGHAVRADHRVGPRVRRVRIVDERAPNHYVRDALLLSHGERETVGAGGALAHEETAVATCTRVAIARSSLSSTYTVQVEHISLNILVYEYSWNIEVEAVVEEEEEAKS